MTASPFIILTTLTALAAAAVGGMTYVFSTFVMRGLDRTGPVDAITAMRGVNAAANSNPAFLLAYFGTAILALVVGVLAVIQLRQPGSVGVLVGAIFVVAGTVITVACNVPLNNRLDGLHPAALSAAEAAREWQAFSSPWTAWNHVRTVTAFVGAALMMVGIAGR